MNLQKQQGRISKMCNANNVIPTRRFFSLLRIILFLFLSLFCISACNAPAAAPSAPLPGAAAAAVTPEPVRDATSESAADILPEAVNEAASGTIPEAVNEAASKETEKIAAQTIEDTTPKPEKYPLLLEQFFDDARVPNMMREQFAQAIYGNAEAQTWFNEYHGSYLDWSVINAVLPVRNGDYPYAENECLFNIGIFSTPVTIMLTLSLIKQKLLNG